MTEKTEICFGVSDVRGGRCNILEGKGDLQKCRGYGVYTENGRIRQCSFYKTKKQFFMDAKG